jgi:hypothetical protein
MRSVIVALALIVFGLLGAVFKLVQKNHRQSVRYTYECPARLNDVWMSVVDNPLRRGGFLPTNLIPFVQFLPPRERFEQSHNYPLVCPGTKSKLGPAKDVEKWMDYTYIDWFPWRTQSNGIGDNYPLMYDRHFGNHGGRGVFVLKVDGNVIWDAGALWLKSFAKKHPEYKIKLPD